MRDEELSALKQKQMNQIIKADSSLYAETVRFEGEVLHPYLDSVGKVTVGVGCNVHLISNALKIHWTINGDRISDNQVRAGIDHLKTLLPNHKCGYYKTKTPLRISKTESLRLWQRDAKQFISELDSKLDIASHPTCVQLALFDMCYNLGTTKLIRGFPKFCQSINDRDYSTAANESNRYQLSDERNSYVKRLLMLATI